MFGGHNHHLVLARSQRDSEAIDEARSMARVEPPPATAVSQRGLTAVSSQISCHAWQISIVSWYCDVHARVFGTWYVFLRLHVRTV